MFGVIFYKGQWHVADYYPNDYFRPFERGFDDITDARLACVCYSSHHQNTFASDY